MSSYYVAELNVTLQSFTPGHTPSHHLWELKV